MRWKSVFLLLFLTIPVSAQSPGGDPAKLTLDRIFSSEEFRGDRVPNLKWLADGATALLEPSKEHKGANDLVQIGLDGTRKLLIPADKLIPQGTKSPLAIHGYELSNDLDVALIYTNSAKVWRQNTRGDYWSYRRSTGKLSKLGLDAKPSTLMFAKLSPDAKNIGYVRENNLYVESIDGGQITKLTTDGTNDVINGTFDWVYEEEFDCRDGWRWSPDGKQIAYWQLNSQGVKPFTLIDNTSSNYPILKSFAYPKTGEQNSSCRIGVVPTSGGSTTWMDVPGDTRNDYYLPRMTWAEKSQELVIQRLNRRQNSIEVMLADVATTAVRTVMTDRDGSWVDLHDDSMKWIEHGKRFTWISEKDGWRQLYLANRDENSVKRVTSGEFDVIRVLHIDEKSERVYFLASPDHPTQQYLYQTSLSGNGKAVRLTPTDQPGWHDYQFSLDREMAIHTYSSFGIPPRIELLTLPEHKSIRPLATNDKLRDTISKLTKSPVEFFRVEIGNDVQLEGWLMKPANFDPTKKYPILFHVYGEPAGQTVTDRWGGSPYLWHLMLTQQGYLVASFDNRGTPAPRGREWRKSVYRKIGSLASEDQAAAAKELFKRPYVDSKKVGVWGWSGGGSMTLNLLFRHPEIYHTGISVAPVPDMRLYDTIYQERYMGLPQENAEDYQKGSPITHAAGLKGSLLIVHGTGDDNCHFQGVEKLVNKLVELNKPFEMMAYPNRSHSISEGKNTSRHLYGLMTRYLNDHLLTGAR